jgi:hypothetical protein
MKSRTLPGKRTVKRALAHVPPVSPSPLHCDAATSGELRQLAKAGSLPARRGRSTYYVLDRDGRAADRFATEVDRRTTAVAVKTARKASLTAAEVGNAVATSGWSATRVVPLSSFAYFPRAPGPRAARSYSERRSSGLRRLAFFIEATLTPRGWPGRDQPNGVRAVGVSNHEDTPDLAQPDRDKAELLKGVVRVPERDREAVPQYRGGLMKRNVVLPRVGGSLPMIPFDDHGV